MNKKNSAQRFFLQNGNAKPSKFNLAPEQNSFNALFAVKQLDLSEKKRIRELLTAHAEGIQEQQLTEDIRKLEEITAQIKSIDRQAVVLVGERIAQAKRIFSHYPKGYQTFSEWLKQTFGSRTAPYQTLRYFQLHHSLPTEQLQKQLKQMPLKAGYVLASRQGNFAEKIKIIQKFYHCKQEEIIPQIRELLPLSSEDKRRGPSRFDRAINILEKTLLEITQKPKQLDPTQKERLEKLCLQLQEILE